MIEVFRLAIREYATPLSGRGAAISGGRWNSVGVELLYTASNRSLAMVEIVVHMSSTTTPLDYVMLTVGIPDDVRIQNLDLTRLPRGWASIPYHPSTQAIGDQFAAANETCVLRVPSAVTRGDTNLLLNPRHKDFERIKIVEIENFGFDQRLVD